MIYLVSIPERVLEALKRSRFIAKHGTSSVSIPERVLEALKLASTERLLPPQEGQFQSLKGF